MNAHTWLCGSNFSNVLLSCADGKAKDTAYHYMYE